MIPEYYAIVYMSSILSVTPLSAVKPVNVFPTRCGYDRETMKLTTYYIDPYHDLQELKHQTMTYYVKRGQKPCIIRWWKLAIIQNRKVILNCHKQKKITLKIDGFYEVLLLDFVLAREQQRLSAVNLVNVFQTRSA